jgi:hypothetical protein
MSLLALPAGTLEMSPWRAEFSSPGVRPAEGG